MRRKQEFAVVLCSMLVLTAGCGGEQKSPEPVKNGSSVTQEAEKTSEEPEEPEEPASESAAEKEYNRKLGDTANVYLPEQITDIQNGGTIPSGQEAPDTGEDSEFSYDMLLGGWELEDENIKHTSEASIQVTITDDGKDVDLMLECLPKSLQFEPLSENISKGVSSNAVSANIGDRSLDSDTKAVNTPFGTAMENLGFGQCKSTFFSELAGDVRGIAPLYGNVFVTVCKFSGDQMALGLTDLSDTDEADSCTLTELDYTMKYQDHHLILTYGDESATYVPYTVKKDSLNIYKAGLAADAAPVNDIYGISISADGSQVMYDSHEGYIDATITFGDGQTIQIEDEKKGKNVFEYRLSDDSLTLMKDGVCAVYSEIYDGSISGNHSAGNGGGFRINSGLDGSGPSIQVGKTSVKITGETDVRQLLDAGFTMDADLNKQMASGEMTDSLSLSNGDAVMEIKAVNPWAEAVPLSECKVCYVKVADTTGTISKGDGSTIGKTAYNKIEHFYEAPYKDTGNQLIYKVNSSGPIAGGQNAYKDHGAALLEMHENMNLIYNFKNDILSSFEIEAPGLLYGGLQDNMDTSEFDSMDRASMGEVIKVRNLIQERLKAAFEEKNLQVDIDEKTGEVRMDSSVLFDVDSDQLSKEGKAFVDSFISVYGPVILDEQFKDQIASIRFEGHTDSTGDFEYNKKLSKKRADAVMKYCLSSKKNNLSDGQKKELKKLAESEGYSFSDLIYDENGEEDQAASRRVAIKFYIEVK